MDLFSLFIFLRMQSSPSLCPVVVRTASKSLLVFFSPWTYFSSGASLMLGVFTLCSLNPGNRKTWPGAHTFSPCAVLCPAPQSGSLLITLPARTGVPPGVICVRWITFSLFFSFPVFPGFDFLHIRSVDPSFFPIRFSRFTPEFSLCLIRSCDFSGLRLIAIFSTRVFCSAYWGGESIPLFTVGPTSWGNKIG